jgi:hypothetical protein
MTFRIDNEGKGEKRGDPGKRGRDSESEQQRKEKSDREPNPTLLLTLKLQTLFCTDLLGRSL